MPAILENLAGDPILAGALEAWSFFHKGFRLREVWLDSCVPLMIQVHLSLGSTIRQERTLKNGMTAKLLCYKKSQATTQWPSSFLGSVMLAPRPRFGFSRAEQKVLEFALLDCSDRDAACELEVSGDAVRKRWRSIYAKVGNIEPSLIRFDLLAADRRRVLLHSFAEIFKNYDHTVRFSATLTPPG